MTVPIILTILIQFLDDKGFYTLTWLNITLILTHCHIGILTYCDITTRWHVNTLTMTYRHWHIDIDSILANFYNPSKFDLCIQSCLLYGHSLYYEYHYYVCMRVCRGCLTMSDSFCWIVCRCVRITPHQPHSQTYNF